MAYNKILNIDGEFVIKEFLLTRGEQIVSSEMEIMFKPLIDFGLILYDQKINATNRRAMQFDLEKYFMRNCVGTIYIRSELQRVVVSQKIYDEVKIINDQYRNN